MCDHCRRRHGLDVAGVPWTVLTPDKLLISEAVWPNLRAALK
jgi:hypothetical protein